MASSRVVLPEPLGPATADDAAVERQGQALAVVPVQQFEALQVKHSDQASSGCRQMSGAQRLSLRGACVGIGGGVSARQVASPIAGLVGQQGGVFGELVVGGQLFQRGLGEGQGQVAGELFGLGQHVAQGALQDALGQRVVVEQQVEQRAFGDVLRPCGR